jgi:hypothetical protein
MRIGKEGQDVSLLLLLARLEVQDLLLVWVGREELFLIKQMDGFELE